MQQMPPPYSKSGYSKVPQSDPYGYTYPPPQQQNQPGPGFPAYPGPGAAGYAPAPQTFQQQSNNTVSMGCNCYCVWWMLVHCCMPYYIHDSCNNSIILYYPRKVIILRVAYIYTIIMWR